MTESEFKFLLIETTNHVLDELRLNQDAYIRLGEPPNWPTTYDINCGWCEDWGEAVEDLVAEAVGIWIEEPSGMDYNHFAIVFRDRWYDAECVDGVDDFRDLPMVKNRGLSRAAVLKERRRKLLN